MASLSLRLLEIKRLFCYLKILRRTTVTYNRDVYKIMPQRDAALPVRDLGLIKIQGRRQGQG